MGIGRRINMEEEKASSIKPESVATNKTRGTTVTFQSTSPLYSLDDLVLPKYTRDKLLDVSSYYENSEVVFKQWGLEHTHKYSRKFGINLWGLPGTGKTMAAHAIADALNRKILVVNYADIESKYVGETSKNLCKAFETAKEEGSILFFDEADAILSRRVTNMSSATDVSVNQTRSQMLMLLNDFQDVIIFATNFIENFDPAFMRRILVHIKFDLPDEMARYFLWSKYIPVTMPNDIDVKYIAHEYEGLSGSDISNAVLSAAFSAAREKASQVSQKHLEEAIKNILDSKKANNKNKVVTTTREVSEEYVKQQLNRKNEVE